MPIPVFPTLSSKPSFGFSEDFQKNVISSKSEGGYSITRPRNTRSPGIWQVPYKSMQDADYSTLMTFYRDTTYCGAVMFTWTHPKFLTTHAVRFTEKPPFVGTPTGWDGTFTVEEV